MYINEHKYAKYFLTYMGDKVDNILESSIAFVIGIVMICALVIPVGVDQI